MNVLVALINSVTTSNVQTVGPVSCTFTVFPLFHPCFCYEFRSVLRLNIPADRISFLNDAH